MEFEPDDDPRGLGLAAMLAEGHLLEDAHPEWVADLIEAFEIELPMCRFLADLAVELLATHPDPDAWIEERRREVPESPFDDSEAAASETALAAIAALRAGDPLHASTLLVGTPLREVLLAFGRELAVIFDAQEGGRERLARWGQAAHDRLG